MPPLLRPLSQLKLARIAWNEKSMKLFRLANLTPSMRYDSSSTEHHTSRPNWLWGRNFLAIFWIQENSEKNDAEIFAMVTSNSWLGITGISDYCGSERRQIKASSNIMNAKIGSFSRSPKNQIKNISFKPTFSYEVLTRCFIARYSLSPEIQSGGTNRAFRILADAKIASSFLYPLFVAASRLIRHKVQFPDPYQSLRPSRKKKALDYV